MNISPTNNSQPAFKGVIAPAVEIYKRPMSSIVFRVVPDSVVKGIQMGERTIESENADLLTRFVANPDAIHEYIREKRYGSDPNPRSVRGLSLRTFVQRVINELGLSHHDRDDLFKFIKSKEMTVQKTYKEGYFELRFEKPKQKPHTRDRHIEKRVG